MSAMGNPVAGDTLYGGRSAGYGRFFLHAHSIQFVSPGTARSLTIEAPLPAELRQWLADARAL
jgi:23S rRNA pseudouridine1911/1915/1917 synthase